MFHGSSLQRSADSTDLTTKRFEEVDGRGGDLAKIDPMAEGTQAVTITYRHLQLCRGMTGVRLFVQCMEAIP